MTTRKPYTARDIPRLKPRSARGAARYRFDPTLYLVVQPSGSRSWIQRIMINGRHVDRGLGGWPLVRLREVQLIALDNRRKVRAGRDPFAEQRHERTAPTFATAAAATLDANAGTLSPSSIRSWRGTMRLHVLPKIGSRRMDALTRAAVIDCLKAIPSVAEARKARQRISAVCALALSREWVQLNVAANGGLDAALPNLRRQRSEHHAAAPHAAVAGIVAGIGEPGAASGDCLRFLILTATRSAEARGATWAEVDTAARTWTIPAARMKGGREHRIPLSDAALAILAERRDFHPVHIFASERTGRPLSGEGLSRQARVLGVTVHGFRSSFRDWASEVATAPREVAEAALAHVVGSMVERSYARSDLLDRRRALMAEWAEYVTR